VADKDIKNRPLDNLASLQRGPCSLIKLVVYTRLQPHCQTKNYLTGVLKKLWQSQWNIENHTHTIIIIF